MIRIFIVNEEEYPITASEWELLIALFHNINNPKSEDIALYVSNGEWAAADRLIERGLFEGYGFVEGHDPDWEWAQQIYCFTPEGEAFMNYINRIRSVNWFY